VAARLRAGERDRDKALNEATRIHPPSEALDHLLAYAERAGRGRVWDSFWSAWDAFAGAGSYRETIERAVAYGNDTDTTAAIAGGLAGIYWGSDGVPGEWLAGMRGHDVVQPILDRLLALEGWRTSTLNPLRVDWVQGDQPWWAPGRLGMTFLPGKQRDGWTGLHWRDVRADARRLREELGVGTLVLLVEDHELEMARVTDLADAMAAAGVDLVRFPIPDMDVTTDRDGLRRVLDDVLRRLRGGQCVAVACRGGLGRTGTIVACLLRDAGLDGDEAIALTRASRHDTIERQSQVDFVHDWSWPPREALA
jgi:protein-tyrosine phosphatase